MSDFRSPLTQGGLGRLPGDLDNQLRRFFRSEMPDPWPAVPEVLPAPSSRQAQARPWFRHSSRLALAAAVGLFLIGYLALANRFPAGNEPRHSIDNTRPTATDPFRNRHLPPKTHNPVNSGKTQSRSDIQLLQPLIEQTPGGHRAESSGYVTGKTIIVNVRQLP
jgi:hypothetical protein